MFPFGREVTGTWNLKNWRFRICNVCEEMQGALRQVMLEEENTGEARVMNKRHCSFIFDKRMKYNEIILGVIIYPNTLHATPKVLRAQPEACFTFRRYLWMSEAMWWRWKWLDHWSMPLKPFFDCGLWLKNVRPGKRFRQNDLPVSDSSSLEMLASFPIPCEGWELFMRKYLLSFLDSLVLFVFICVKKPVRSFPHALEGIHRAFKQMWIFLGHIVVLTWEDLHEQLREALSRATNTWHMRSGKCFWCSIFADLLLNVRRWPDIVTFDSNALSDPICSVLLLISQCVMLSEIFVRSEIFRLLPVKII